jgi:hypothetical protein
VSRGQSGGSPTVVNLSFLGRSRYFLSSSSSFILTRLSGPRSRPTATQKIWFHRKSNPGPLGLQPETLTTRPQRRSQSNNSNNKVMKSAQRVEWRNTSAQRARTRVWRIVPNGTDTHADNSARTAGRCVNVRSDSLRLHIVKQRDL